MKRILLAALVVSLLLASCGAPTSPSKQKSTDNDLASLSINVGTLSPDFSSGVTTYTVNGLLATDAQLTVTAAAANAKATVTGTGAQAVTTGDNALKVRVTAESGAVKIYTLNANRPVAENSAQLSGLAVDGVPVAGFDADDYTYELYVPNSTTSVNITATPQQENATVSGTGTKTLSVGENTVTLSVSGATDPVDYTLKITRADPDALVVLGTLSVNGHSVDLIEDQYAYTVTVDANVLQPEFTATEGNGGTVSAWTGPEWLSVGDNVYSVQVSFDGSILTYTVTIVRSAIADASEGVAAGITFLKAGNYNGASAAFTSAYALNPNDNAAKLWSALLDLSSINTDSHLVDLYKNKLGVASYPADLNEYLHGTWFNAEFYGESRGFAVMTEDNADTEDGYYIRGNVTSVSEGGHSFHYHDKDYESVDVVSSTFTASSSGAAYLHSSDYETCSGALLANVSSSLKYVWDDSILDTEPTFLPELSIPEGFEFGSSTHRLAEYPLLLMANIIERNPTGLNGIIDTILNTTYGSKLAAVETRLNALDDDIRIEIPEELLGDSSEMLPEGVALSVSKSELKLLLGQLKLTKAWLQYLSSVDFTVALSSIPNFYSGNTAYVDENENDVDDRWDSFYTTGPTLKNSNFLGDRTNGATKRAASKATFVAAIQDLQSAVNGLKADWNSESSYYKGWLVLDETADQGDPGSQEWIDETTEFAEAALFEADNSLTRLAASLNNGTALTMDMSAGPTFPLASLLVDADETNTALVTVNPNGIWAANLLNPRVWFSKTGSNYDTVIVVDAFGTSGSNTLTTFDFAALPYTDANMTFNLSDFYADPDGTDYSSVRSLHLSTGVLLKTSIVTSVYPQMTAPLALSIMGNLSIYSSAEGPFTVTPEFDEVFAWLNRN